MDKNQTTQQIKDTLGVSLTVAEVEQKIADLEAEIGRQAPYFNGRDLDRLSLLRKAVRDYSDLFKKKEDANYVRIVCSNTISTTPKADKIMSEGKMWYE